jgi:ABC-type Fe3+/spermidine/putrescine transport system ATPase subunit
VLSWADEILVLQKGRLVQQGSPERIYHQPANEYTAALFGDYNLVHGADRLALAPATAAEGGRALLVRPEQFRLSALPQPEGVAGTVQAVRFYGPYYEVEVKLTENTIRARVTTASLVVGDTAYVQLTPGSGWVIG